MSVMSNLVNKFLTQKNVRGQVLKKKNYKELNKKETLDLTSKRIEKKQPDKKIAKTINGIQTLGTFLVLRFWTPILSIKRAGERNCKSLKMSNH